MDLLLLPTKVSISTTVAIPEDWLESFQKLCSALMDPGDFHNATVVHLDNTVWLSKNLFFDAFPSFPDSHIL